MRPYVCALALIALAVGCSQQQDSGTVPTVGQRSLNHRRTPKLVQANLDGCLLYAAGDSVINYDLTSQSVDPANATVMSHLGTLALDGGDTANSEIVNWDYAISAPKYTVQPGDPINHPTPIASGVDGGGSGAKFPWETGWQLEGNQGANCSGNDCHDITILNDGSPLVPSVSCSDFESYQTNFHAGTFTATDGFIDNLSDVFTNPSYIAHISNKQSNVTVSGISLLPFTYWSEDKGTTINHPVGIMVPLSAIMGQNASNPGKYHTNYSPKVGYEGPVGGAGTCGITDADTANCLELGDILRLKPGYNTCGAGASDVVNELKTYGAVVTDVASQAEFREGLSRTGADSWKGTASQACLNNLKLSNFELMTREPMSYF